MWQLDTAATYASSGSTLAGLDQGAGTTEGDGDAGTTTPPSKVHVCSREYLPFTKSVPEHFQLIVARCFDMSCGKVRNLGRLAVADSFNNDRVMHEINLAFSIWTAPEY
jgi:hypothetical protein